jgi:hypothetical protein
MKKSISGFNLKKGSCRIRKAHQINGKYQFQPGYDLISSSEPIISSLALIILTLALNAALATI